MSEESFWKELNFVYKINGELSTNSMMNDYRPLVFTKFQKPVTSLFFAGFCSRNDSKVAKSLVARVPFYEQ